MQLHIQMVLIQNNTSTAAVAAAATLKMCIYCLLPLSGALTTDFVKYEYERVGAHSLAFCIALCQNWLQLIYNLR